MSESDEAVIKRVESALELSNQIGELCVGFSRATVMSAISYLIIGQFPDPKDFEKVMAGIGYALQLSYRINEEAKKS